MTSYLDVILAVSSNSTLTTHRRWCIVNTSDGHSVVQPDWSSGEGGLCHAAILKSLLCKFAAERNSIKGQIYRRMFCSSTLFKLATSDNLDHVSHAFAAKCQVLQYALGSKWEVTFPLVRQVRWPETPVRKEMFIISAKPPANSPRAQSSDTSNSLSVRYVSDKWP